MFCNIHSEVECELVLGYEMVWVQVGSRYELVRVSWLGYELAWYDLVRVRVDWKPYSVQIAKYLGIILTDELSRSSHVHSIHSLAN